MEPLDDHVRERRIRQAATATGSMSVLWIAVAGCASARPVPEPAVGLPAATPIEVELEPAEPIATPAAPHPFDLAYSLGDWSAALEAFESDPKLQENARALYRTGLMHAMPGRDTFDPQRATDRLTQLLERFPESDYGEPARVVLGLVAGLEASAERLAALEQQLEQLKAVDLRDPPPPF